MTHAQIQKAIEFNKAFLRDTDEKWNELVRAGQENKAIAIGVATIMIAGRIDELNAMLSVTEQPTTQPNDKKTD
jgi:hypothetical protein